MSVLTDETKYQHVLLHDAFLRELDVDFLRPILNKCAAKNASVVEPSLMLTHLELGGDHLTLLRPWLTNHKEIDDDFLGDTLLACWQMKLAAAVGELDLASQINKMAFAYSKQNDFGLDNADYFYLACVYCGFYEEANDWLHYGYPDEWDLPAKLYTATGIMCSRGDSLEDAELFAEPNQIDCELIFRKWLWI